MHTAFRFSFALVLSGLLLHGTLPAQTDSPAEALPWNPPHGDRKIPGSLGGEDALTNSSQPFDVLHYDVAMNLTAAPARTTDGICTTTLVWTSSESPEYTFHLRELSIDSAFYDGVRVEVTTHNSPEDASYRHTLRAPVSPGVGDTGVVTLYYSGEMSDEFGPGSWGGVSSGNGILYAMGVGFSNNYVSTTQHWFPCYDHPADKATFTGHFTVAPGMSVASNGLLTEQAELENGNRLYTWDHIYPAATYLLTFAVGPYAEINIGTPELPMVLYSLPNDSTATKLSFAQLPKMVTGFAKRFGTYPFEKVGYVNTPQGAMEHQTMVSFPTSVSRSGDSLNLIGAHELAHQWFGDLVSPVDFRHAWLNESFATYCESVWLEELGDFSSYIASQEGKINAYINRIAPREGIIPLYDFPRTAPSSNYPATIYEKGAVVVGMLRFELGDSLFYAVMREYLGRYAYGNASTDDLIDVCEELSGKDLGWFFDQWVRRSGWPQLQIDVTNLNEPPGARVHIRQTQNPDFGAFRNLPVEIGFITKDGIEYRILRMNEVEEHFQVTLDSAPDDIIVNRGPSVRTLLEVEDMRVSSVHPNAGDAEEIAYRITPNRVSGSRILRIYREGPRSGEAVTFRLFDSAGRRVGEKTITTFPHSINIQDWGLAPGHYLAHLMENHTGRVIPVVIER